MTPFDNENTDILIVDDLPDNIRFLSNFLTGYGYSIRKATSGRMAQVAIAALVPDLILLDINLGDMSGFDLCQQLKQADTTCTVPIIFLSAVSDVSGKLKAFQVGGSDYITKPFHLEEVLARVQTQLKIKGLQTALERQNVQLQSALDSLKQAQENRIRQETMATLKKMVAGVFHEVNNPLSFIVCNIEPAHLYMDQLAHLIDIYERHVPDSIPEAQSFKEEIDLPFILSDMKKLFSSIKQGSYRIHNVTQALKNFTHLDESPQTEMDLCPILETALATLSSRLSSLQEVMPLCLQQSYSDVPPMQGYAEPLTQVLIHLLSNAMDAIEEKWKILGDRFSNPCITLTTQIIAPDQLLIQIHDNGIGIPSDSQVHLFEPFFSTKPGGRGLGLGLVTSRRIIEDLHGGQITCQSSPTEGTLFTLQLPLSNAYSVA